MAGVRVQHPTARNCRFTLTDPNIEYRTPYQCTPPSFGGCGAVHTHKTHHLNIDETGAAIVNDVLYQRIRLYLYAHGFIEANVVEKPPTMGIGFAGSEVVTRNGRVTLPGGTPGAWSDIPIIRAVGDQNG